MKYERVNEIIQRHYEHHDSKYVYGGRALGMDYYYNTTGWEWYIDCARSLNDEFLNHPDAPNDLTFNFYDEHRYSESKCDLFIKVKNIKDIETEMDVYAISGLIISNSYGKIGMKVKIIKNPLFSVKIRSDLTWKAGNNSYPRFEFTWWVNRLLRENERFRLLFIDILQELSTEYEQYVLKDIARTIKTDHFFLPRVSLQSVSWHCHTPDELIRYACKSDSEIDFNKWNINAAYYSKKLSEHIKLEDEGILFQIPQSKLISWIGKRDLFDGPHLDDFAAHYYADRLDGDEERIRMLARDYARMCIQSGEKMSLRKNSVKGLEEEHDRYIELMMDKEQEDEFAKPLIAENTRFAKLREMLPEEFVWIDTTKALYHEGKNQRNCVYSYKDRIRCDMCTIYHWSNGDKEYTIEFVPSSYRDTSRGENHYEIAQMLQCCNKKADPKDWAIVESYIGNNKTNEVEIIPDAEDWI